MSSIMILLTHNTLDDNVVYMWWHIDTDMNQMVVVGPQVVLVIQQLLFRLEDQVRQVDLVNLVVQLVLPNQ